MKAKSKKSKKYPQSHAGISFATVAIMGDGGFMMNVQELATLFKNPDFVKLANAFGIPAWRARTYEDAEKAIAGLIPVISVTSKSLKK